MRRFCAGVCLIAASMVLQSGVAAQEIDSRVVKVESSRNDAEGRRVTVDVVFESAGGAPKAVLLVMPSWRGSDKTPPAQAHNRYEPDYYPLSRNRESLLKSGLAIAWMGWPSESEFGKDGTTHYSMRTDISRVIEETRRQWPGRPLIIAGTYGGGRTALAYVLKRREDVDGMLALSPYWLRERESKVESLRGLKTLVLHDTSGECIANSAIEMEEIAARAGFSRIPVHRHERGRIARCDAKSGQWLPQIDGELADVVGKWLDGQTLPDHLGADVPVVTTTERVVFVESKSGKMEVTLYVPPGEGPFPVFMFNHGDTDVEHPAIRAKERLREPVVSPVFLAWGFAVAVPARPGVARSQGVYGYSQYSMNDGDPTYKARNHSEAVLSAIEGLKKERDLDFGRLLLSGQSAGGDAVMYMSTLPIPGLRGVVNFSGGRSNHAQNEPRKEENRMMIEGWAQMGKSAKVPVMLVFAENDSHYSANTIRKSAQAFNDAGGKAELLLAPSQDNDGHFVFRNAKVWASRVYRFVAGLGMGNKSRVTAASSDVKQQAAAQERSVASAQTGAGGSSNP